MTRRVANLGLLFLAASAVGCAVQRAGAETAPTFRISAEGRATAQADRFELSLAVITEGTAVDEAVRTNNARVGAVVAALRGLGLEENAIRSGAFEVEPQYATDERTGRRSPGIVGYSVANAVTVSSTRLALAGKAIEAGVDAGANEVAFLAFSLADASVARDDALRNAVVAAHRQASVVADASGFALGPVQNVELHSDADFPRLILVNTRGGSGAFRASGVGETPLIPGAIETTAEVTVEYRIEPR